VSAVCVADTVTLTRTALAEVTAVPASVPGVVTGATIRIPMTEPGSGGKRIMLEATLYRPEAEGPHPVLLFNHGSTGGGTVAPSITIRPSRQAQFFVERGFAVLAPMRRGRGASDGASEEYEGTCALEVLSAGFARAIQDVDFARSRGLTRRAWWSQGNREAASCPSRMRPSGRGRSAA
jgi:dipeptidyl aminopeptidase/acylaminoacyl peptidase